ncbi:MAG: aldehyde dehydrogenase family protein [Planctomycetes bacterium]|nr:aldehyde dehydrogenase family protein [Planctomycetota bacterium]
MSSTPHIPALRFGKPYESLDKIEVPILGGQTLAATVSQVNAGMIKRDARKFADARAALRKFTTAQLLAICEKAGEFFMTGSLPLGDGVQSAEDYIRQLSSTSGLPYTLVRANMAKINEVFTQMSTILRGLTRGLDLSIIDAGAGEQAGVPVSYFPTTTALGVVLPSNSPGVNSLWMPAFALKIPVILKPGREEPWTPYRIIQSFIAAGAPAEAFGFYPTDHEGSAAVMDACGRSIIFGGQDTADRYAGNPAVEVHGPGWSKVLITGDAADRWPDYLDVLVKSIAGNSGRSCINASAIVVTRNGRAIAEALAKKLAAIKPLAREDNAAMLSGFANAKMAQWIDAQIDDGLKTSGAEDLTAKERGGSPRMVEVDGITYLMPTIIHCDNWSHPLANREFMFPFASVVEVPEDEMLEKIGPSLVVTAIGASDGFVDDLLTCPLIQRLNIGPLPTSVAKWDQPHEGNLFEFLYHRRAIQRAGAPV